MWTANKILLTVHKDKEREEPWLDLHIAGVKKSMPPPQADDFVPWTPELVPSRASSSVIVCTPESTGRSDRVFINLDTPWRHHSEHPTNF